MLLKLTPSLFLDKKCTCVCFHLWKFSVQTRSLSCWACQRREGQHPHAQFFLQKVDNYKRNISLSLLTMQRWCIRILLYDDNARLSHQCRDLANNSRGSRQKNKTKKLALQQRVCHGVFCCTSNSRSPFCSSCCLDFWATWFPVSADATHTNINTLAVLHVHADTYGKHCIAIKCLYSNGQCLKKRVTQFWSYITQSEDNTNTTSQISPEIM